MKHLIVALAAALACVAGLAAQAQPVHAIGCISRAGADYVITDTRADPPLVYHLDGDKEELDFHVGHTVEVSGPLSAGSVLKVEKLVWISNECQRT